MDKKYEPLFTPWKIGNVEIKNRIVMTSMGGTSIFGWLEPNHFDKEAANFLLERAKNNVGLILPGIAPIKDIILGKWLYQGKGKFKELKEFMDEFHKTGAKMFVQMTAGFGRSMAINDIMVKACKNKALGLVMKPILDMDYLTASASATPNRWEESCMSRPLTKKEIDEMVEAFGGRFFEAIIGGAAFNHEVEQFLASIHFPYTVGYGATECGPIIAYDGHDTFVPGSCGKAAPNMEVKILSSDPEHVPGEIICRGPNVMLGYYKNEKLTEETIDKDGWMYTGDLGIMDKDGNIFIKGRSKSLILGPSGQNIYPEEIEESLNNMNLVNESVVISENEKLVALVYPDFDEAMRQDMTEEQIAAVMEQNRTELNATLPAYEQISQIRIYHEEFEKTPKKSIKRFLYQKD